jgi:hypothetical protein
VASNDLKLTSQTAGQRANILRERCLGNPVPGFMSLAYPIRKITIKAVLALDSEVAVGSVWETGNLLFRTPEPGSVLQFQTRAWARGVDPEGRAYILWKAARQSARRLVIQALDSHYCFEVFPV